MPLNQLLSRLDQTIAMAEAFSPLFLELHKLRSDIVQSTASAETEADLDAEFQAWLQQQDYQEACLWSNY